MKCNELQKAERIICNFSFAFIKKDHFLLVIIQQKLFVVKCISNSKVQTRNWWSYAICYCYWRRLEDRNLATLSTKWVAEKRRRTVDENWPTFSTFQRLSPSLIRSPHRTIEQDCSSFRKLLIVTFRVA